MEALIANLVERQATAEWSDREMARQLGIAEASWHRIKAGSRGMGPDILRRVLRRFPDLTPIAMSLFFDASASRSHTSAAIGNVEIEAP